MLTEDQITQIWGASPSFIALIRAVERATAERCAEIAWSQYAVGNTPSHVDSAIRSEYGIKD